MKEKVCLSCGINFIPLSNNHRFCGSYEEKSCSYKNMREKNNFHRKGKKYSISSEQKEKRKTYGVLFRKKIRSELFLHYGDKCVCCKEDNKLFLTFDHINNDAFKERKEGKYKSSGFAFHLWLRKNNFPSNIQVLCWNCNCGKRANGGTCPHANI